MTPVAILSGLSYSLPIIPTAGILLESSASSSNPTTYDKIKQVAGKVMQSYLPAIFLISSKLFSATLLTPALLQLALEVANKWNITALKMPLEWVQTALSVSFKIFNTVFIGSLALSGGMPYLAAISSASLLITLYCEYQQFSSALKQQHPAPVL